MPVAGAPEFIHSGAGGCIGKAFPLVVYVTKYCVWYVPVIRVGWFIVAGLLSFMKLHWVLLAAFAVAVGKVPVGAVPEVIHSELGMAIGRAFPVVL